MSKAGGRRRAKIKDMIDKYTCQGLKESERKLNYNKHKAYL